MYLDCDLELSQLRDVIGQVTVRFLIYNFLQVFRWDRHSISNIFWDIMANMTFEGHVTLGDGSIRLVLCSFLQVVSCYLLPIWHGYRYILVYMSNIKPGMQIPVKIGLTWSMGWRKEAKEGLSSFNVFWSLIHYNCSTDDVMMEVCQHTLWTFKMEVLVWS